MDALHIPAAESQSLRKDPTHLSTAVPVHQYLSPTSAPGRRKSQTEIGGRRLSGSASAPCRLGDLPRILAMPQQQRLHRAWVQQRVRQQARQCSGSQRLTVAGAAGCTYRGRGSSRPTSPYRQAERGGGVPRQLLPAPRNGGGHKSPGRPCPPAQRPGNVR